MEQHLITSPIASPITEKHRPETHRIVPAALISTCATKRAFFGQQVGHSDRNPLVIYDF